MNKTKVSRTVIFVITRKFTNITFLLTFLTTFISNTKRLKTRMRRRTSIFTSFFSNRIHRIYRVHRVHRVHRIYSPQGPQGPQGPQDLQNNLIEQTNYCHHSLIISLHSFKLHKPQQKVINSHLHHYLQNTLEEQHHSHNQDELLKDNNLVHL